MPAPDPQDVPPPPDPVPERLCDLVMQGGITSGVVYPLAVCELARTYRFANIGGTSAGAIAAAAAAAAEYGRGVAGAGFERLAGIPDWLGSGRHLFDLFQPQAETRALFDVVTAGLAQAPGWRRAARVAWALVRHFAPWIVAGALPAIGLGWAGVRAALGGAPTGGAAWAAAALVVLAAAVLGAAAVAVALGVGVVRRVARALPANGYGLCRGYDPSEPPDREGLVRWLDGELDRLAGRTGAEGPLTFGDLWGTRPAAATEAPEARAARALAGEAVAPGAVPPRPARRINLEMITTNLTHGQPYRLPFRERVFYFDPAELRRYLTPRLAAWMEAKSPRTSVAADGRPLCALPLPEDLPVAVATRLSLSFPGLISAVPLYAVDFSHPDPAARVPERCWFSDGGIASNFPIHFFDTLIPRWPTFGIDLRPFTRDYPRRPDERENIYMARTNGDGMSAWWTRFDEDTVSGKPRGGLGRLAGFVGAILDAMRNWRDNAQVRVPGFRDRVVHVKLDPAEEGGLNLDMPPDVIAALTARGRAAGALLVERYAGPEPAPGARVQVSWANHRWVRYRTTMGVLQSALRDMRQTYDHPFAHDVPYATLVARPPGAPPTGYAWTARQRRADPVVQTGALLDVVGAWDATGMDFCAGAPRPTPDVRIVPRV